ncbi:MAG: protein-L-isoaspartate(D-aspartate) O-methyltransferase [Burkholderiaceae bacterium]
MKPHPSSPSSDDDRSGARERMVDSMVLRGIRSPRLLSALRSVPREVFVAPGMEEHAYNDRPLPIAEGQTISQPYIVAAMLEAAAIGAGDTVLEIGAGSGYAAAVLSRIAKRVYAIERHPSLVDPARARLAALGCDNVELQAGDGSRGWPGELRFDAIVVSAGGPDVPPSLKAQLAPGGRLVMPVGEPDRQRLVKLTRRGDDDRYDREDLGAVAFVPLVGEQGWADDAVPPATARPRRRARGQQLPELLAQAVEPLPEIDDPAFGRHFDRYADRRIVMLGEASHGSAEFYRARAAITRHLIERHGYGLLALEADGPDAAVLDRHVRGRDDCAGAAGATLPFQNFPSWVWRNAEFAAFVAWLRGHNQAITAAGPRTSVHGLDIYSLVGSIAAVLAHLDAVDPPAARIARERYGCLTPWQNDPATDGRAALHAGDAECEAAVVAQCRELLGRQLHDAGTDTGADVESLLDAAQNARLAASAERYYRVMYHGGAASWNLRDSHLAQTLAQLLEHRGPRAKAIVWAHNAHIGDARHTDMGRRRGELNLGQLARQRHGEENVALIGFGSHAGSVAAAHDWDGPIQVMPVRPSLADSVERLCHDTGAPSFLLDLRPDRHPALRQALAEPRLQRYIGVVYRPETERRSHCAEASLAPQYDAWVWFDRTSAVTPLGTEPARPTAPETWPFGL